MIWSASANSRLSATPTAEGTALGFEVVAVFEPERDRGRCLIGKVADNADDEGEGAMGRRELDSRDRRRDA